MRTSCTVAITPSVVKECAFDLLYNLPVLILCKANEYVAIDVANFVFSPNVIQVIGTDSQEDDQVMDEEPHCDMMQQQPEQSDSEMVTKKGVNCGRKRIADKFPSMVDAVLAFIQEHSYSAHNRRREAVASCGVSLYTGSSFCYSSRLAGSRNELRYSPPLIGTPKKGYYSL